MSVNTETGSNVVSVRDSTDGFQHGKINGASAKLGFYGATPVVQPTAAAQAAVTDGSGGTASATSGVQALTSSYNSAIIGNALASIIVEVNGMRTALVNLGLIKGS